MNQKQFKNYLNDVIEEKSTIVEDDANKKPDESAVSSKITPISSKIKNIKEANATVASERIPIEEIKTDIVEETKNIVAVIAENPDLNEHQELGAGTVLILEALNKLIDKVDVLINTAPPEIIVPAPIVKLTLPESKNVVKRIVRNEETGLIDHIVESPEEPLLEQVVVTPEKPTIKKAVAKKAPVKKAPPKKATKEKSK